MKAKNWSSLLGTGVLLVALLAAVVSVLLKQEPDIASTTSARKSPSRYTGGMIQTSPIPGESEWSATPASTTIDSVLVRRAQGLRDEYFKHYLAWIASSRGVPTSNRRLDQTAIARQAIAGDREIVCLEVALWYLKRAYRRLNPQERRVFLEQGDKLLSLHGGIVAPQLELVPPTLNRDSLLASYDDWLMPGEDNPPWAVRQPSAHRHDTMQQYRRELARRGLVVSLPANRPVLGRIRRQSPDGSSFYYADVPIMN